jgi:hypothetical protein
MGQATERPGFDDPTRDPSLPPVTGDTLVGLKGWLILPILDLCLTPIMFMAFFIAAWNSSISTSEQADLGRALTLLLTEPTTFLINLFQWFAVDPTNAATVLLIGLFNLMLSTGVCVLAPIVLLVMMIKRHHLLPTGMIAHTRRR